MKATKGAGTIEEAVAEVDPVGAFEEGAFEVDSLEVRVFVEGASRAGVFEGEAEVESIVPRIVVQPCSWSGLLKGVRL